MGVPVNGLTVFLGQSSAGVSAAGALTNPKDLTATVIGVGQAVHSVVSIATTNIPSASIPIAGAALGTAGAINGAVNIIKGYNSTNSASSVYEFPPEADGRIPRITIGDLEIISVGHE